MTGQFYTGDSYILLSTVASKSGSLSWAIHFWLGAETSSDEAGIAAYKSVELDESLGGGPVQYREVQGNESQLFLGYFKNSGGVQYLPGGISSGFKKVERDVYETRLLHVKGKRTVRVSSVPVAASSLNRDDVFILDKGLRIFLFNGPTANKYEKSKGIEVASCINSDERGGRAELVFLDSDPQNLEFWEHFGGYRDPKELAGGENDDSVAVKTHRKLFKISNASGNMSFDEVTPGDGKLSKALLDDAVVFLLHAATGKIFLWIGRGSNLDEKREAMASAVRYVSTHALPASTLIERVSSGCESASFKAEFAHWDPPQHFRVEGKVRSDDGGDGVDVAALLQRKAVEDAPVDDGSGQLQIYVIKDFKKVEVPASSYGEFFGGDSYILLYTYRSKGGVEQYLLYFWLGRDSTADEKGAAALLTVQMDEALGGKPVQVRVTQGKEPAHFRQLFQGSMVVYAGGHASGFTGVSVDSTQADVALFHVKGSSALNTFGLEVEAKAASLNAQDCFCLVTLDLVYVWHGAGANEHEITTAHSIANVLASKYQGKGGRAVVSVREGAEDAAFWAALGGQGDYPQLSPGEAPPREPRLFSASTASGRFKVEEVDSFEQGDLNDEDVFLLDTFTQLFVWIGSQASAEERSKAFAFAHTYVAEADDGRDPSLPIIQVQAGQEPAMFSAHFHGWDATLMSKRAFKDPYAMKLEAMQVAEREKKGAAAAVAPAVPVTAPVASGFLAPIAGTFSLAQLKEALPATVVDPSRKEEYLSDGEFQTTFGMDRKAFAALAKWRRDDAKKRAGIF